MIDRGASPYLESFSIRKGFSYEREGEIYDKYHLLDCAICSLEMLKFVIEELMVPFDKSEPPLTGCVERRNIDILKYLLSISSQIDPLILRDALHKAFDITEINPKQSAIKKEIIELLLGHGAKF